MTRTIIDIHVLQTVPPSNLNRDDTGSPKTAVYGGVRRARVSSQAWKRATRSAFGDTLDPAALGVRTRRVVQLLAAEIDDRLGSPSGSDGEPGPQAVELATKVFEALKIKLSAPRKSGDAEAAGESGYLIFLSRRQIENLAAAAVAANDSEEALDGKLLRRLADTEHSIDIALFGRMVAELTDINVDAAAQVAHAISVHPVETEFDYFTAVDDQTGDDEMGAGMIGTVEFNSSTLYRYATLDVDRLQDNLGDAAATASAVEAFVDAFVRSMPTGKQNTFANRTLPEAVVVQVRDTQPVNLVGAFEAAIRESALGRIAAAAEALAEESAEVSQAYGETPLRGLVTRVGDDTTALDAMGERVPFPTMTSELRRMVAERLQVNA